MKPSPRTYLEDSLLDRRAEERLNPDWVRAAAEDPKTRYLIARGTTHLVHAQAPARTAWLGGAHPVIAQVKPADLVLLGWFEGVRVVLVDLPPDFSLNIPGTEFQELRPLLAVLPTGKIDLLAMARALTIWRSRHRHCGVCGAVTEPRSAGHVLRCTNPACANEFFPRIDPAIIVLVTDGERALLGRQKSWPPGQYSALAGFVEPGESLEQTVVREVGEETGTKVTWVRYIASQAWPFPASIMLGFHAGARHGPIHLDGELEDARWFELGQLQAQEGLRLPPPFTIARRLIDAWVLEQTTARS